MPFQHTKAFVFYCLVGEIKSIDLSNKVDIGDKSHWVTNYHYECQVPLDLSDV